MRQILDFNENWWFIHADVDVSEARPGEGELVSLPHTWNALDGQKGDGTYDRGSYWYVGAVCEVFSFIFGNTGGGAAGKSVCKW